MGVAVMLKQFVIDYCLKNLRKYKITAVELKEKL